MRILIDGLVGGLIAAVVGLATGLVFKLIGLALHRNLDGRAKIVGLLLGVSVVGTMAQQGVLDGVADSVVKAVVPGYKSPEQRKTEEAIQRGAKRLLANDPALRGVFEDLSTEEGLGRALDETNKSAEQRRIDNIKGQLARDLVADPEFRARFGDLKAEENKRRAKQWAVGASSRGMARLDDYSLRERAKIMNHILSNVGEATCVAIARGTTSEAAQREVEAATRKLDGGTQVIWMDIVQRAMLADLHQTPAATVSQEQLSAAMEALGGKLGESEASRLISALTTPASDADVCWAAQTLNRVAPNLPEPHATVLLRVLAGVHPIKGQG